LGHRATGIQLGDEAFLAVDEPGAAAAGILPQSSAEGIVAVGGEGGAAVVFYLAEPVFQVVDIGGGLAGDGFLGGAAVGVLGEGDGAVGGEGVGVVILPGAGEPGVAGAVAGRVIAPGFIRQGRIGGGGEAVAGVVTVGIGAVFGGLSGDVADRVVLVLVIEHGVGGRVPGGDLFDPQQGIVGEVAGAAAGVGDPGRGVPGVLVPDDGALARQVDLRQFQYVGVLYIVLEFTAKYIPIMHAIK